VATILLARHGETDWNREQRRQGHADPPLNPVGRAQAWALAERLAAVPLGAIYVSDLRRALETASIVAARKNLPVEALPALREVDVGSWTGLTLGEVRARFPEGRRRRRQGHEGWEGGETYAALAARVLAAVEAIAAAHPAETVLVVSHDGPIRVIAAKALGLDFAREWRAAPRIDEGGLLGVIVEEGELRLEEPSGGLGPLWA
jgi:broad specificity phosphatase PhoE